MKRLDGRILSAILGALLLSGAAVLPNAARAAVTELSNVPVAGTGQAVPKPNVMLLMDTSRSMAFTHMPDELEFPGGSAAYEMPIGYRSAQCNALYYNPAKVYEIPRDAAGNLQQTMASVNFSSARYDFYSSSDVTTVDLSTAFRAYDRNTRQISIANTAEDRAQPAYYYVYQGTAALAYNTAPCTDMESNLFATRDLTQSSVSASTTGGQWVRKLVTSSSGTGAAGPDERRNFAIWYTYYRTRMAMVKSSISLAFNPITETFRVGLISMNPLNATGSASNATSGVNSARYLAIADFDQTQKNAWYAKLFSQTPDGSSPAREGLARVGRHFAGRMDGINTGMTPDPNPENYSCRQNFTIMTTDGYWNTAQETVGPVQLDGSTRVGNQDGLLTPKASLDRTDPRLYSHRPMWDGTTSGSRTDSSTSTMNRYATCDTGEFYRTTSVVFQSTSQPTRRTQSLTRTTEQVSASTSQTSRSTTQDRKTTQTELRAATQTLASTQQQTLSTRQELITREWWGSGSRRVYASTTQNLQTTTYMEKTVYQLQTRTRTQTMRQTRVSQTTEQTTKSTSQLTQSTSQLRRTDTLTTRSTNQPLVTRTYQMQSTRREFERTSQLLAYDGATERSTPVASCTNTATITCMTLTTGPTPVASCTPQTASASNNYLTRTCDTPVTTGPTAVASCSAQSPSSNNNYTTTTCATVTNGPTPAASCTPAGPSASNGYATVTCSANTSGPTAVTSCTPGTNASYVTTTCNTSTSTNPVASCTPGTNSSTQVVTTCNTATTGPTGVNSCSAQGASSSNNYTATTCNTVNNTSFVPAANCTAASASSGNNYTTTTCSKATLSGPTRVASCTAGTGSSPNYIATICTTEVIMNTTNVASCTASAASSSNDFITTTCGGANFGNWSNVSSCTAQAPTSSNNFLERQCQEVVTSGPSPVQPSQCAAGTTNGVRTACQQRTFTDVPVASCVPNTAGPSYVTCRQVTTGPTLVASCTPGGDASTNYVFTTCSTTDSPETNVGSCTPQNAGPGNGNVGTYCNFHSETVPTPPGSCTPQTGNGSNNYVTIKCPAAVTTGPTGVPLGSCSPVAASSANAWTATTCAMNGPTTPAPVATCTSGTSANFTVTTCSAGPNTSPSTNVTPGSCTSQTASASNGWTTISCTPSSSTVGVAQGSCVAESPSAANGYKRITCATVNTGPTFVAAGTCSAGASANFTITSCNTVNTGPTLVASCTEGVDANFKSTTCSYNTSAPIQLAPGTTCNSEAPSSSNNYTRTTCTASDSTVGVAAGTCVPSPPGVLPVVTCNTVTTPPTPVASCSAGTDGNFLTTTCAPEITGPDRVSSCTPVAASAGNGWKGTTCVAVPGTKIQSRTRTTTVTYDVSGDTAIESTAKNQTDSSTDWADSSICYATPAAPPPVDVSGNWSTPVTVKGTVSGSGVKGSSDSLADVAQYYYVTDLRPSQPDDIPRMGAGIEDDRAPWQHMTTFVVGLGVSGTVNYREDYKSATTGDFANIRSYENTPPVNWPIWPNGSNLSSADYNDPRSIDDFWHTAVNGRGKYFSARDPQSVVDGLKEALAGIKAQAGAGAGASTSSLTPTAGDNIAYTASFTTQDWTGEVQAQELDTATGDLSSTVKWSAQALLDAKVGDACDNRNIYTRDPDSNSLVGFTWNTQTCGTSGVPSGSSMTGLTSTMKAFFQGSTVTGGLSQYPYMTDGSSGTVDQRSAVVGANLVNYLRGQRGREGFAANTQKLYRQRAHVLGDIVNSQPAYVKAPSQFFQDTGYGTFKENNKDRTPMVYVGANDGMLHAFYAPAKTTDTNYAKAGQEAWAFVPQAVMANLYKLADTNYTDRHQFFVDGTPITGDAYVGGAWKTMLVGGLGGGGAGYYALDITDPTAPKAMWEFNFSSVCPSTVVGATSDCNVGLTFGRPIITKLRNGQWVVLVTSGYNNVPGTTRSSGTGEGFLYVLNAANGQIIQRIGTGVGSTTTPSGLREINTFVNNFVYDNTAQRVYGGDLLGNIWRFDINDVIPPTGFEATRLATAKDAAGNAQPITTRPELAEVNGKTMVLVGTGKMLSTSDLTDPSPQTVYGFEDPLSSDNPLYSNLRTQLKPLKMTTTGSGATATRTVVCASNEASDCSKTVGWYIDLPDDGERVNVDMQSVLGTLVFATNVPSNTMCAGGGYSWLNYVDLITGEPVASSTDKVTSVKFFTNSVVVGLGIVALPDGTFRALGRDATGATKSLPVPVGSPPPQGKRISWREIVR